MREWRGRMLDLIRANRSPKTREHLRRLVNQCDSKMTGIVKRLNRKTDRTRNNFPARANLTRKNHERGGLNTRAGRGKPTP